MRYNHPVFPRGEHTTTHTGVVNVDAKEGEPLFDLFQGATEGYDEITHDVDAFLAKLRRSHEFRRRLGIPSMTYHAYGFPYRGYNVAHLRNIVEWARGHGLELRTWVNEQSASLLLVIADPDLSEDSGWTLLQYIKQNVASYQSYGLSSWFEFCQFGTPVPDDWLIVERDDVLFVSSPNGKKVVMFG